MARRFAPRLAAAAALSSTALFGATDASAQGCVVARQTSPAAGSALADGQWQLALSARWFRSSRHFVGTREQTWRERDGSQSINEVTTAEVDASYGVHARAWLTATLPYFVGERSDPVLAPDQRSVVARARTSARGVGDATVGGRIWLRDPTAAPTSNVALGLGVKLPTGEPGATAATPSANGSAEVRTVDASIQPGDGGVGVALAFQGFVSLGARASVVASGSYVANPRETNGVPTFRPRPSEAFLSVPDAYLARAGVLGAPWPGVTVGLAARIEGTPVRDMIGGDDGFRRPGYTLSAEPTVSVDRGAFVASLSVPIALSRNRLASVPERRDGVAGDAAFADYSVIVGLTHRFAAPAQPMSPHDRPASPPAASLGGFTLSLRPDEAPPVLGARLTVVNVWATWCHACRDEIPLLGRLAQAFAARGVRVVGVSIDEDSAAIAPFLRQVPMPYPTFWAAPEATRGLAGATLPITVVLDARGAVVHRIEGAVTAGDLDAKLSAWLGDAAR